ncbi:DNA cytosine methyltransferase [Ancylobacter polymorphus]|uniref:DNA (Cytosine-5)-methyltransferase 1 n=1 Tax=Ancylobacter polymorphus TaxID=223390 RepID=A0ABU0BDD8_9HYPH|nr:DNA cytosine methyltransferase [Ancylobacter polymorphus]MDQ0303845.1 DNA (cytosine-5)-methyltransferase 1 [Ancylobacter polymorphus]
MARAYYNEIDPYAAQWLRNLIAAGHIAPGDVDTRSIADVRPDDLAGYTQCHFFAGIGGWSYAARLAGWPDERPLWTASAPCPPWSRARIWHRAAAGEKDPRDLWPAFVPLVADRRPADLFGEQVSGRKVGPWIERAKDSLQKLGYAFSGTDRRSRDHEGPQGRERFYFSAHFGGTRGKGLVSRRGTRTARPWRWRGEEDLRAIASAPFEPGHSWPQPLIRRSDDGVSPRVAALRAYGNAIDPYVAAEVIGAFLDAERDAA